MSTKFRAVPDPRPGTELAALKALKENLEILLGQRGEGVAPEDLFGHLSPTNLSTGAPHWDHNGNLTLDGTAPSPWEPTINALEDTPGALAFSTTAKGAYLVVNAYYDGTNWRYKAAGTASMVSLTNGNVNAMVAPSGAANATITWTNALTVDNGGRILASAQPAFCQIPSANLAPPVVNVWTLWNPGWTSMTNRGNCFAGGRFTAPVDGIYEFSFGTMVYLGSGGGIQMAPYLTRAGATNQLPGPTLYTTTGGNNFAQVSGSFQYPLLANDIVDIRYLCLTGSLNILYGTYGHFSGKLLG